MNVTNQKPSVVAVVLNWNGLADTRRCLESLRRQGYPNVTTVVIDNGSEASEAPAIRRQFPEAVVFEMPENIGFARGVNVGIEYALERGLDYVLLLNNDAWFDAGSDTIAQLVRKVEGDATIGAAGPIVLNATEPNDIQSAGHQFSLFTVFPRRLMAGAPRNSDVAVTRPSYIVGACLLIPQRVLRECGGFDPDFFAYGEDIDFALRTRRLGYAQAIVPSAAVYHRKSVSTKMWSEDHTYLMLRSHLILCLKHLRWYHIPTALLFLLAITVALSLLGLENGYSLAPKGALRAWYDFVLGKWGGVRGKRLGAITVGALRPRTIR